MKSAALEFRMFTCVLPRGLPRVLLCVQLSALGDFHGFDRLIPYPLWNILNLLNNVVTFYHLTEYNMLSI